MSSWHAFFDKLKAGMIEFCSLKIFSLSERIAVSRMSTFSLVVGVALTFISMFLMSSMRPTTSFSNADC